MLKKVLIFSTLAILLILIILYSYISFDLNNYFRNPQEEKVNLTYWGILYPESVMNDLINEYESLNPNVDIEYTQQKFDLDHSQYKNFLRNRVDEKNASDIVEMHASWLPEYITEISLDNNEITKEEFEERFYPVALNQNMTSTGKFIGVPLNYDGLMLIYNKDHYNAAQLSIPQTWDDFKTNAETLTIFIEGDYVRYGAAMGSGENITHSTDILALMLTQNRVVIPQRLTSPLSSQIFQNFLQYRIGNNPTWSNSANQDYEEFARGKLSMMFATQDTLKKINQINRTLNIGFAPVPQLPLEDGSTSNIGFASYYSLTVLDDLNNTEEAIAWDFVNWLGEADQQILLNQKLLNQDQLAMPYIYSNKNINDRYLNSRFSEIFSPLINTASISVSNQMAGGVGNEGIERLFNNTIDQIQNNRSSKKIENELEKIQNSYLRIMSRK